MWVCGKVPVEWGCGCEAARADVTSCAVSNLFAFRFALICPRCPTSAYISFTSKWLALVSLTAAPQVTCFGPMLTPICCISSLVAHLHQPACIIIIIMMMTRLLGLGSSVVCGSSHQVPLFYSQFPAIIDSQPHDFYFFRASVLSLLTVLTDQV